MKGGGWQRGAAEGKGTSDRCQAERMGHSFRVGAGGGGRGGGEESEGSPNDATPNLSVPICVSQRGSPKVAGLYVPDRGARSEEGQEETARGARGNHAHCCCSGEAHSATTPKTARNSVHGPAGPGAAAGPTDALPRAGARERQKQSARKINSSGLELFFFPLGLSTRNIWILYVFFCC